MPESQFWNHVDVSQSVLLLVPGWMRDRCRPDSMHCSNLGIAWLLVGNILVWCADHRIDLILPEPRLNPLGPNASFDDVLHDLQCRFKLWLSDRKLDCSTRRFTHQAVHRTTKYTFPCFQSKAAQSPFLVAWLADLTFSLRTAVGPDLQAECELISTCAWAKAEYYSILRRNDRFLSDSETKKLDVAGHTFLFCYSQLRYISYLKGDYMWSIIPKFHQFHHLLLDTLTEKKQP